MASIQDEPKKKKKKKKEVNEQRAAGWRRNRQLAALFLTQHVNSDWDENTAKEESQRCDSDS